MFVQNNNLTKKIGCCGDQFWISGDRVEGGGAKFSELEANRLAKKIKTLQRITTDNRVPKYQKESLCFI